MNELKIHQKVKLLIKQYKSAGKTKAEVAADLGVVAYTLQKLQDPKYEPRIQIKRRHIIKEKLNELLDKS